MTANMRQSMEMLLVDGDKGIIVFSQCTADTMGKFASGTKASADMMGKMAKLGIDINVG
jgi:hypothetical protein